MNKSVVWTARSPLIGEFCAATRNGPDSSQLAALFDRIVNSYQRDAKDINLDTAVIDIANEVKVRAENAHEVLKDEPEPIMETMTDLFNWIDAHPNKPCLELADIGIVAAADGVRAWLEEFKIADPRLEAAA